LHAAPNPSFHVLTGLRCLLPCGLHSATCLAILASSVRMVWPYHLNHSLCNFNLYISFTTNYLQPAISYSYVSYSLLFLGNSGFYKVKMKSHTHVRIKYCHAFMAA
jgi:hypothetical protein